MKYVNAYALHSGTVMPGFPLHCEAVEFIPNGARMLTESTDTWTVFDKSGYEGERDSAIIITVSPESTAFNPAAGQGGRRIAFSHKYMSAPNVFTIVNSSLDNIENAIVDIPGWHIVTIGDFRYACSTYQMLSVNYYPMP